MQRQKKLLNFFSKSQNKDNDLVDYCTPDTQKKCTVTKEPMVAIEERKKRKTAQRGSKITAMVIFKLRMPGNLLIGLQLKEMPKIKQWK